MTGQVSTATDREQIYSALFTQLQTVTFSSPILTKTTWAGSARKYVDPSQINGDMLPFMSQFEGLLESYTRPSDRLPAIRTLNVRLYCWVNISSGDAQEVGSQYLNYMMQGIEAALAPDTKGYGAPDRFSLGGLVQWCRIEGNVLRFPGDTENLAMLCVPIRILWP